MRFFFFVFFVGYILTEKSNKPKNDFTLYTLYRTVGMGELNMVLNGIEFKTRHNDYRLRMPARHSHTYNAMENIQYPPVPPAVLNKKTVHEQILEMREWFRGTLITLL